MKLRILGNSVRIRISRAELSQFITEGLVRQRVAFGTGEPLVYELRSVGEGSIGASFQGQCVSVEVPQAALDRWQRPEEVSISAEQALPGGSSLKILVEKDFQCLVAREDEDQSGLFANPQESES